MIILHVIGTTLLQIYLDINIANQFIKLKKTKMTRKTKIVAKRNHHVR